MKLFLALAIVAFVGCAVEGRAIQARDVKDTLITKGNDLLKKADEAVKKLTTEHKTHDAAIIKTEEAKIKKLIADLTAETDEAKIKTLEHQLSAAEHKLQFDIQKASHTMVPVPFEPRIPAVPKLPIKRAAKDVLITKGNDLLKKADEAIKKLEADKKTHEVTVVKSEEAKIKKLIADLEAATDDAKIKTIEHDLNTAESKLQHELAKVAHSPTPKDPKVPTKRDTKSDLITKANDLLKKADAAIAHLRTGTHLHEVAIVKHQEDRIKKLVADLEAATDDAKVTQLEHELTRADHQLEHQLTLIQTRVPTLPHRPRVPHIPSVPTKRAAKDALITKGNDLLKKADEAVKKLTTEHKTHDAAIIKTEEAKIKKLIADLTAETDEAKITTLEHQLSAAEHKLQFDIQKATHTPHIVPAVPKVPTKRAAKDALITKGNDLLKQADEAIKKLEADKKTHEATVVKGEEAKIKKLIADLEAATDDAKIKTIEHDLSTAENKLQHELVKIAHTPTHKDPKVPTKRDTKSDLITKANALLKKTDDAIAHLRTGTHLHEVAIVKHQEDRIKKLVADLEAATDDAKVTQLEHELTRADHQLEHELTLIHVRVPTLPHIPRVPHLPVQPNPIA